MRRFGLDELPDILFMGYHDSISGTKAHRLGKEIELLRERLKWAERDYENWRKSNP
jgi:hypothetical protein